ncbi:tRNA pseudouridine(55) synthase TruB [bacterium]|nr:tRNA pseudouridine(55) synthase TruB [bacterium]
MGTDSGLPLGFLNINKPKGMTSHDVVGKLRKILGLKQIGHTGTLDPFATGVLPICIGKATKLIEYLPDDKEYIATVQFGKSTDTYDLDGETVKVFEKNVKSDEIICSLKNFEGDISQLPPIYSAIKKNGKKLYEYARAGETVEIEPRQVKISQINLLDFDEATQIAKIKVACSAGTYIRSIANDLGNMMECGGYLIALERTKAGKFTIEDSHDLSEVSDKDFAVNSLIYPTDVMDNEVCDLSESEAERISHGMPIKNRGYKSSNIVFLVYSGKIHGVGLVADDKILAKKVFEVL